MTFNIYVREPYADVGGDDWHRPGITAATRLPGVGVFCSFATEHGAVVTRALTNVGFGGKGMGYLEDGLVADDILQALLNADDGRAERQLHSVGPEAAFASAGNDCSGQAGHREGDIYTVASNLLTGEAVVDTTVDAYERTAGGDKPFAKRLIDALDSGRATGGDECDDLAIQSAAVVVTSTGDREMEPYYNGLRTDVTETSLYDLREIFSMAREGYEAALEKHTETQPGGAHVDPETTAVGSDREFEEVVADVVDRFDDLAGVTDEVGPVFERATHGEHLVVGLLRDDHQTARLDGFVGLGGARACHVGPAEDRRDRVSVDRDDVRRRRELVRALDREKRLVVDVHDHRLAVDEDDLAVDVRELGRLEHAVSEGDVEE